MKTLRFLYPADPIVEIGDGQVSDLVGWSPERFAKMWRGWVAS